MMGRLSSSFDFSRKVSAEDPSKKEPLKKQKDGSDLSDDKARSSRFSQVVLTQVPADRIRVGVQPGLFRIDFPDARSDTEKGSIFVKSEQIRPSLSQNGGFLAGKADVTIFCDENGMCPYFISKDKTFVRVNRSGQELVQLQREENKLAADAVRAAAHEQQLSQEAAERSIGYE